MPLVELIMPKMGESVFEATIISWAKKPGDEVEEDETLLEVATDKVDSEIPSPVTGTLVKILHEANAIVQVGEVLALIQTTGQEVSQEHVPDSHHEPIEKVEVRSEQASSQLESKNESPELPTYRPTPEVLEKEKSRSEKSSNTEIEFNSESSIPSNNKGRFYSPLVRNMATLEGVSLAELDSIVGTGANGRVSREDFESYLIQRLKPIVQDSNQGTPPQENYSIPSIPSQEKTNKSSESQNISGLGEINSNIEIVEMGRMRKLIADHMVRSKHEAPHVCSFVEVDVSAMVLWRNLHKKSFESKHGERLTFSPMFAEAVIKALQDFPRINASLLDGDRIAIKKQINLGIATAMENGNLIVPVIKNAGELNLMGLAKKLNDLTGRARINKLKPDEIQDGSFTITNIGTFGNTMGTPIINQPQLAILAIGVIQKKPVVQETELGDIIAIRHMMFLSLSYDHRVIDGFLGGTFLKRIAEYIESFDTNRPI